MKVRVGRTMDRCRVLGPGLRAVIWVAGCGLRCKECIAPEFLDRAAGSDRSVEDLARWVTGIDGIAGLTLSGGEPFDQAAALADLVDRIRGARPGLSTMVFTGYTLDRIRTSGSPEQHELLSRMDLVVDGPYIPTRHIGARWRGSANQQLHVLSTRHDGDLGRLNESAGIEILVDTDGAFALAGVPATRGLRGHIDAGLAQAGVVATAEAPA